MAFQPLAGGIHRLAQILHAGQHGIEAAEVGACVIGDDSRQGGFADAGRPMQDQVADAIGLDCPSQQASIRQDPALALKLLQGLRAHAVGQRSQSPSLLFSLKGEKVLAHSSGSKVPIEHFSLGYCSAVTFGT